MTAADLLPRLDLIVDFGAVHEGHPIDRAVEITRATVLDRLTSAVNEASDGGRAVVLSGGPGTGKSWLCEQLGDRLRGPWIVARHHCWLGTADAQLERRVLTEVVIGSLLKQLDAAAPDALADLRPRYTATAENLETAVAQVRRTRPDVPVLLVVDGLDHVTRVLGRTEGSAVRVAADPAAALVAELAAVDLVDGVALLLASQPGDHLEALHTAAELTVPPMARPEVAKLADRMGVVAAFPEAAADSSSARIDAALDLIHERSRGNALYATYLCRQAVGARPFPEDDAPPSRSTSDPLERLRDVPASAGDLDAYYTYLFDDLTDAQKLAVGLLAVCDFAVTAAELGEIFPQVGPSLPAALDSVAPIVTQQPGIGGLKIHHESFGRFIRANVGGETWLAAVRGAAADWLAGREFFTDARAFRHLPELLVALGRDEELAALVGRDFLSGAIAGLQPPSAVTHVLSVAARRSADRRDWPSLVRLVQLRNATDQFEAVGVVAGIVDHADVLVELLGAESVAASLIYDGRTTVDVRWGLQLCAAVDAAGVAAPWRTYLEGWEASGDEDNVVYGQERDDDLQLAVLRGRHRVSDTPADAAGMVTVGDAVDTAGAERLAALLREEDPPPLRRLLDVIVDIHGAALLLESTWLIEQPTRRGEVLLHLADISATGRHPLPPPSELAVEAWRVAPGLAPRRMLRHDVPAVDLAGPVLGPDADARLHDATAEVLADRNVDRPANLEQWLAQVSVAHEVNPVLPTRLLPELEGPGFYRAWLRFFVTTVGLERDLGTGVILPADASAAVRVALERLADAAQPFTGRPRASDLWPVHGLIHDVVQGAVAHLRGPDLEPAMASLSKISDGTTTRTNLGTPPSGPLVTTDLLTLLSRTVGRTDADIVHRLADQLRRGRVERHDTYSELAEFEFEMARACLTAGDRDEARTCWHRAAHFFACYGSHKDGTIYELLNVMPDLAAADPVRACARLARLHRLTVLVTQHTNGRGTSGTTVEWWRQLADLDPAAAADLAGTVLLTEPHLEDARAEAVHHQLLRNQLGTADPVVLAALRVAAGPKGREVDTDATLLEQLAELPEDDPARAVAALPLLANAIGSTYDDQPLMYTSDGDGPEPDRRLRAAAERLGGDGAPSRPPKPDAERQSRWLPPRPIPLEQIVQGYLRPDLPADATGAVPAIRDHAGKRYDDDNSRPRWAADALSNAVGWRLLQEASEQGADAGIRLLRRIVQEFYPVGETTVLADIACGLDARLNDGVPSAARLASTAYILAFTTIRGGGGWLRFAGRDRPELWHRAVELDIGTATSLLANEVASTVDSGRQGTFGVTEALVSAFARAAPDATDSPDTAFDCWDAAFEIIERRLPGSTSSDDAELYEPTGAGDSPPDIDAALARLATATLALPARDDRRRALVAATVLVAARTDRAQAAAGSVLAADLGAGPLQWLLTVVEDGMRGRHLDDDLATRLTDLARSDLLSVRAQAARILEAADRPVPYPPATAAHPILRRAVIDSPTESPE